MVVKSEHLKSERLALLTRCETLGKLFTLKSQFAPLIK